MKAVMRTVNKKISITVEPVEDLEQQLWDELMTDIDKRGSLLEIVVQDSRLIIKEANKTWA